MMTQEEHTSWKTLCLVDDVTWRQNSKIQKSRLKYEIKYDLYKIAQKT